MKIYIFGFPQSLSYDRTCTSLTRFPARELFLFVRFFRVYDDASLR